MSRTETTDYYVEHLQHTTTYIRIISLVVVSLVLEAVSDLT